MVMSEISEWKPLVSNSACFSFFFFEQFKHNPDAGLDRNSDEDSRNGSSVKNGGLNCEDNNVISKNRKERDSKKSFFFGVSEDQKVTNTRIFSSDS